MLFIRNFSGICSYDGVNVDDIKRGFFDVCNLPNVVGAIDCTHIEIQKPAATDYPDEYINRKGWHSINVQAICDAEFRFLDVVVKWP